FAGWRCRSSVRRHQKENVFTRRQRDRAARPRAADKDRNRTADESVRSLKRTTILAKEDRPLRGRCQTNAASPPILTSSKGLLDPPSLRSTKKSVFGLPPTVIRH